MAKGFPGDEFQRAERRSMRAFFTKKRMMMRKLTERKFWLWCKFVIVD